MKKLFLCLCLVLCSTIARSEVFNFYTERVLYRTATESRSWYAIDRIGVTLNSETNSLIILSPVMQVINLGKSTSKRFDNMKMISYDATDTNYKPITVSFLFYDSGDLFLAVKYFDILYQYDLKTVK
jgi:hypothetical protein